MITETVKILTGELVVSQLGEILGEQEMKTEQYFFSYQSFANANPGRASFDYVHGLVSQIGMSPGDFNAISRVQTPELIEFGGLIFVKDLFSEEKYKELLSQNHRDEEIQYWMNLLEITELFAGWSIASLSETMEIIATGWHAKLSREFPGKTFDVKRIVNLEELAVTFHNS